MPRGGEQYGAWFDHRAAEIGASFFPKYLRYTEGEWYGKPFKLTWQEEPTRQFFGWKRKDGTRLIRTIYGEVAKKNGKTEWAGGMAMAVLTLDGDFGAQGYSMALSKEQSSDTVIKKIGRMVSAPFPLSKDFIVLKEAIYCPRLQASFRPLSTKVSSKDGFSVKVGIADELHEWPDGELHRVVHKNTMAWAQPIELLITTAGEPGVGYGWDLHEYALDILSGEIVDPTFLPIIYAADPADDWEDPATWRKANPNYGISVKEDFLRTEALQAKGKPKKISDFKRFHLNIWNAQVVGGIVMDHWRNCPARPVTLESLKGRHCIASLDLSSTNDLTALTLLAPWDDGKGYDVWWHFWLPAENLKEKSKKDRVNYDKWIEAGHITATEGPVVDYDAIRAMLTGGVEHEQVKGPPICAQIQIDLLAIDGWNATQISSQLTKDGLIVVFFRQGYASMNAPSKELQRLLGVKAINHGGNPVAEWMAQCTEFVDDGAGNIKPLKPRRQKSKKRIDGIVTLIMAIGRSVLAEQEPPSVYDRMAAADKKAEAEKPAGEVAQDSGEIDYEILQDPKHPRFPEMKRRFEEKQAREPDEDF
jgi:phage terminase large subunit-like protein